ncbi:MAG TPA: hypothetical protein VLA14_06760 [Polyangia bacterium]|nr:hypothetical protein [Polyangia bacterium]
MDAGASNGPLTIQPASPIVKAVGGSGPPTVQFQATRGGGPVDADWSLDRGELGQIDRDGLFTASGNVGGVGHVTATYGQLSASTTVTVDLVATDQGDPDLAGSGSSPAPGGFRGVGGDGAGKPPALDVATALGTAPRFDPAVSLLYPYDGTVFPQGLLAPLVQWSAGTHAFDGVRVSVSGAHYQYVGTFGANHAPFRNLPLPQAAWDAMTQSSGGGALEVSLVFSEMGKAFGPYTMKWNVAAASLHGTIYYNSYGTSYVKNSPYLDAYGKQFGAGTLAISPGATSPKLVAGVDSDATGSGCRVCHTVSGAGTFMVTQANKSVSANDSDTVALDLMNDATMGAGSPLFEAPSLAFPALSRDATLLLSSSGPLIAGDSQSRLYAMPAATFVPGVTGLPSDFRAGLPSFSPDTHHLAFNFWSGSFDANGGNPAVSADRASLVLLDFDGDSAFSNPRVVFTPPASASTDSAAPDVAVTFSAFLPDSNAVVFALQLSNKSHYWGYTWGENTSELWWVDLATQKAHRLDALNGRSNTGVPNLPATAPHSAEQDAVVNYEPTVGPIAAGGYAWIVFTSRRQYGNVATANPWQSDPRNYSWQDVVTPKKLWVAAVDLNAAPGSDSSHPAFYLPAQELYAGNARGYWSFDPCRGDGASCETGDQCCGGFCRSGADGALTCDSNVPTCAGVYERCSQNGDCCDAGDGVRCINSVCTAPPVIP